MTETKGRGRPARRRLALAGVAIAAAIAAWPSSAVAYDIHRDRLDCPKGTTLLRIEENPRVCRARPQAGVPATRGRRACCTIDRDPSKIRCLPFPGCAAESPV
jgi:hypothetical protein